MDSKQIWYGQFYKLEEVYSFLNDNTGDSMNDSKINELFLTWVLARFLQFQKKSEHLVGFPTLISDTKLTIAEFLENGIVLNDENFDTVMIDGRQPKFPMRIQIKRYMKVKNPSTDHFFKYLCSKVKKYGNAPELNILFHINQEMKFNLPRFGQLLRTQEFKVASVTVFAGTPLDKKCFLFEVHPEFTGQLWSPISK